MPLVIVLSAFLTRGCFSNGARVHFWGVDTYEADCYPQLWCPYLKVLPTILIFWSIRNMQFEFLGKDQHTA